MRAGIGELQVQGFMGAGHRFGQPAFCPRTIPKLLCASAKSGRRRTVSGKLATASSTCPSAGQGVAQICVCLSIVWLETHGRLKASHCFRQATLLREGNPEVVVRLRDVVLEAESLAKAVDSKVAPA